MKGLIFIYSNEIYLRFIESDAFYEIEKKFDITYVLVESHYLSKNLEKNSKLMNKKIQWINFIPARFAKWCDFFDISCTLFKDTSPSFQVRYEESARQNPNRYQFFERFSTFEAYKKYRERIENEMGYHSGIIKVILFERPDFIIIPSSILDFVTDDILQIAEYLEIPTILLVSGWDNLSSKGLLYRKPSIMGVWGEQSKIHAIQIQKMYPEQVFVIGAPHYEQYRVEEEFDLKEFKIQLKIPANEKIALFAGTFRLFDETQLLKEIDDAIESGNLPKIHLIYRPHPYRVNRKDERNFFDYSWNHITFDPQLAELYSRTKKDNLFASDCKTLYEIKYLNKLYQTVDMVISPMSTILLEGMIFGRPILAVAFNDQKHSWSADQVSRMHHFKELYENPDILICRDRTEIFDKITQLYSNCEREDLCNRLKSFSIFFVKMDSDKYSQKLSLELTSFLIKKYSLTSPENLRKSQTIIKNKKFTTLSLIYQLLVAYYKNYIFFNMKISRVKQIFSR